MLFGITYISKASRPMSEEDLFSLLQQSAASNKLQLITGMLLFIKSDLLSHTDGRFIQAIEGPEIAIKTLFQKIVSDNRHFAVTKLSEGFMSSRNFNNWSMGFKAYSTDELAALPGGFELTSDFLKYDGSAPFNRSLDFLKQFYELNSRIPR